MGTRNFAEALGNLILQHSTWERQPGITVYRDPYGAEQKYKDTHGQEGFYQEIGVRFESTEGSTLYIALIQRQPDMDVEAHS